MKRSEMTCATCLKAAPDKELSGITICRLNPIPLIIVAPGLIKEMPGLSCWKDRPRLETDPQNYWCAQGAWKGIGKLWYSGKPEEMVIFWTDIGIIEEEKNK